MRFEPAVPGVGWHRLANLGEIGHPSARRLVAIGREQPQHRHVDAVMLAGRLHHRFRVLPPGQRHGHARQAADHGAVSGHQHQLCDPLRLIHPNFLRTVLDAPRLL